MKTNTKISLIILIFQVLAISVAFYNPALIGYSIILNFFLTGWFVLLNKKAFVSAFRLALFLPGASKGNPGERGEYK